jgi:hypothetical protein
VSELILLSRTDVPDLKYGSEDQHLFPERGDSLDDIAEIRIVESVHRAVALFVSAIDIRHESTKWLVVPI